MRPSTDSTKCYNVSDSISEVSLCQRPQNALVALCTPEDALIGAKSGWRLHQNKEFKQGNKTKL